MLHFQFAKQLELLSYKRPSQVLKNTLKISQMWLCSFTPSMFEETLLNQKQAAVKNKLTPTLKAAREIRLILQSKSQCNTEDIMLQIYGNQ